MPPVTLTDIQMPDLVAARERFLDGDASPPGVRPVVLASWRRSQSYGVHPSRLPEQAPDPSGLAEACSRHALLLESALPVVEQVHVTLGGQPHVLAVSDPDGLVLRLFSSPDLPGPELRRTNLLEGASWHERDIGSNGVGTALAIGEPVVLIGPEHFQEAYLGWTCIGVPLTDGEGTVVGALDLSVPNERVSVHTWGWALSLAHGIESRYRTSPRFARPPVSAVVEELDRPLHAVRGVLELLATQVELQPTHADYIAAARRELDAVEAEIARREARANALRSDLHLKAVLEVLPVGVFIADAEGRLLHTNEAARRIWEGQTPLSQSPTTYGDDYTAWWPDGRPVRSEEWGMSRALATGEVSGPEEMRIQCLDGREKWILNYALPIRGEDGTLQGAVAVNVDVTERKRAQEEVRRSEARFRTLAEASTVGLLVGDLAGALTYANPVALAMLGYSSEQFERERIRWDTLTPPEYAERDAEAVAALKRDGVCASYEKEFVARDGTRIPVLLGATMLNGDSVAEFVTDLRPLREAREAAERSEQQFRTLADSIPQLAWMADPEGRIFWYNRRWYDYTGTTLEEVEGWGWRKLHHPDHVDRVVERISHSWATGDPWEDTFPLRRHDGDYRWFLSRALPIRDDAGRIVRWFGTNTDVTAQREIEAELRRLNEETRRAVQARDDMMAVVSHDLRNPLNTIRMAASLLQDESLSEDQKRPQLSIIQRAASRMADLLENLLDVTRIESGKLSLDRRPVHPSSLLGEAVELARPRAEAKSLTLETHAPAGVEEISVDPSRILQVLSNLIGNAIDHTEGGGLIRVSAQSAKDGVVFEVADTGEGISDQHLPHVFDRFWQARRSTREGAGLGLAIARGMVEAHGGRIWAESTIEKGSRFRFVLPSYPG
ncbi:MAG: PAS domain S-box protein [Gemmatimonadota bacterium]